MEPGSAVRLTPSRAWHATEVTATSLDLEARRRAPAVGPAAASSPLSRPARRGDAWVGAGEPRAPCVAAAPRRSDRHQVDRIAER